MAQDTAAIPAFLQKLSALLLLALVLGLVAACGGGGDDDEDNADPSRTTAATATADPGDGGDDGGDDDDTGDDDDDDDDDDDGGEVLNEVEINETFYHAGFQVDLDRAELVEGDFGGAVVFIYGLFHNLGGADNAAIDSRIALRSGSNDYLDESSFDADIPAIPARGQKTGNFAIRVDDEFSLEDATLFIGHPDNNQAIIPFGPGSPDDLLTLAPVELTFSGHGTSGAVEFDVVGGEIRADLPDDYGIADKDHLELRVNFEVTPGAGIQVGQGVLLSENVELRQPDGSVIKVRGDGRSGVSESLQGNEGNTIDDLSVRFEVEKPVPGEYAFIIVGNYGPSGAETMGEVTFTVTALPTLGE